MAHTPQKGQPADRMAITDTLYAELRCLAGRAFAGERSGHTLQPTAVVNEACMRILSSGLPDVPREQQLALAGRVLKQVLIDHARARNADKRGGSAGTRLTLDQDILADDATIVDFEAINAALERLRSLSERQAEVVSLRIFSGMTMDQIATLIGISKRAAEGDWTVARAWLRRELASKLGAPES
jgi:RNA polymerase sigma factor (TIGR02999 family)